MNFPIFFRLCISKFSFKGSNRSNRLKYLIVDETQDYSAVQYAVLSRLFTCNETILGDSNQNVNPYSSTSSDDIVQIFPDAEAVTLRKSYRFLYEITNFMKRISPHVDVEPVERHDEMPEIRAFRKAADEIKAILEMIRDYNRSEWKSPRILCNTQKQARSLHKYLVKNDEEVHLLTQRSFTFSAGVLITGAHLDKGFEFDQVIVPHVSAENYGIEIDRSMLYIAFSRAMHKLTLTHYNDMNELISK